VETIMTDPPLTPGEQHDLGATVPQQAPTLDAGVPPLASGASLPSSGRYRVVRSHARGGLGEVFVALDQELHREVALKEIHPCHADHPGSRARFVLEAEITGALEHPGVVPVYGLGVYPDGRPYYAMRFIHGQDLKDAIRQFHQSGAGAAGLRPLLGRFVAVCNAVAYAHSRGVLHRDLKPANIMLGAFGETLVVDWGLAKVVGGDQMPWAGEGPSVPATTSLSAAGTSEAAVTVPGSAVGTPAYMSPEQAAGRHDEVGPASDVYSLGATLYHLLTGKAPPRTPRAPPPSRRARSVPPPSPPSAARPWRRRQRTAIPVRWSWRPTWSAGWPTSRSRPTGSRGAFACAAGWPVIAPW
jgi:serine/threonine protein kinase